MISLEMSPRSTKHIWQKLSSKVKDTQSWREGSERGDNVPDKDRGVEMQNTGGRTNYTRKKGRQPITAFPDIIGV